MATVVTVGTRLCYDGHLCTVKFVGEIAPWPQQIAYGVEWDEPSRGRNNGNVKGVQYFKVRIPGSGSFIKSSREFDKPEPIEQIIIERYCHDSSRPERPQYVGISKTIEYVPDKMKALAETRAISLAKQLVAPDLPASASFAAGLPRLIRLDLSCNLFSSMDQVYRVCSPFSSVRELILNGNRLCDLTLTAGPWSSITELSLAGCYIPPLEIEALITGFPLVRWLCFSSNGLTQWVHHRWDSRSLEQLDLSFNDIAELESPISNVSILNLSHNKLKTYSDSNGHCCVDLDLSHNLIDSWDDLQLANCTKTVKLNGNPIFERENDKDSSLAVIQAIGRYRGVEKLNGTMISASERSDLELYFMSKLADDKFKATDRWKELVKLHGAPAEAKPKESLKSKVMTLNIQYQGAQKALKVLKTADLAKVKLQAAKLFALRPSNVELLTETGESLGDVDRSEWSQIMLAQI